MPARIIRATPVLSLFAMFSMKGNEMRIFQLLMKKPMTIKQLQKASRMSERMLRTHLGDLTERSFVSKKVVEGRRLKYVYYASPPEAIIGMAKNAISRMQKKRARMGRDIVHGSRNSKWGG